MLEPNDVVVRETGAGLTNEVVTREHRLIADEPVNAGGAGQGPDPYQFLLTALGACTSMTLRLYAKRKNLPLEHVSVQLRHRRIHASDCGECETKEGKIDRIEREISLTGPLDEAQRQSLLAIAEKCPIHKTLTSEISIVSRLMA